MALFRRGLPKRAVLGAFIGFVYGVLLMPTGGWQGLLMGVGWVLLSVSLLFGRPSSYYTYITWGILWVVWRGFIAFQADRSQLLLSLLDVAVPLASVALLSASGYVESVHGPAELES